MGYNVAVREQNKLYKSGLDKQEEAVISAHFMHKINRCLDLQLYSDEEFLKKALSINSQIIFDKIIPRILKESDHFIKERAIAANMRARENYKIYGLSSPNSLGISEVIAEVMFDRQFLKGSKENFCRKVLRNQVSHSIEVGAPIKMVLPALPYKFSSPLKSRGTYPDFSEINFLLGVTEITKTIDYIYRSARPELCKSDSLAMLTIVSDGRRFNDFLNEPEAKIQRYQVYLENWIKKLNLERYIKMVDYKELLSGSLPATLRKEKFLIKKKVAEQYDQILTPHLDPNNMNYTMKKTVELEPDPEKNSEEGRFVPLFKSLIYIINYKVLEQYTKTYESDYIKLYQELTRNIFEPYTDMEKNEYEEISNYIWNKDKIIFLSNFKLYEYLRRTMLYEVWNATIQYIAEIRSDRDLKDEPISTCLPDHIRWTIHAKLGQLAILTSTAYGDSVQAWCGTGVFKLSKKIKIKLCTLPILSLEGAGAIPVIVNDEEKEAGVLRGLAFDKQPIFYIYPDIEADNIDNFINKLENQITRKRKINVKK